MKHLGLAFPAACLSLFVGAGVVADPSDPPADAAQHRQRISLSADGGVCRTASNGDYRCRSFVAQAMFDAYGEYESTRVGLFQLRNTATTNGYRSIECTIVDPSVLAVSPNQAIVHVVMEADSPSCVTYGSVYHSDTGLSENWVYSGQVPLDAELRSPAREWSWAYPRTFQNHATGESLRENCVGGTSADPAAGGMQLGDVYFPFGPDDVEGSFFHERCNSIAK